MLKKRNNDNNNNHHHHRTREECVDLGQFLVTHPEELFIKPCIVPGDDVFLRHLGGRRLFHRGVQHRLGGRGEGDSVRLG